MATVIPDGALDGDGFMIDERVSTTLLGMLQFDDVFVALTL